MLERRIDALEKTAEREAGGAKVWADIRAALIALAALASPWIMHFLVGK